MRDDLKHLLETERPPLDEIAARTAQIHEIALRYSRHIDQENFTAVHAADLERLFNEYDRLFLKGNGRQALQGRELRFRVSHRMTRIGGRTTWLRGSGREFFEIAVSAPLLFQSFEDTARAVTVTGLVCRTRLEALSRVFEHELVHLAELLAWSRTTCRGTRFQEIAARLFGHQAHTHRLVTPREQALAKYGIRTGSRVRFELTGRQHRGIVNRITRRATVLVPDERGQRYSDGQRYVKYYVPLNQLEPA